MKATPTLEEFWIGLKEGAKQYTYLWVDESGLEFGEKLRTLPWKPGIEPNGVLKLFL